MKFLSLKDNESLCKGWREHGAVNEDRTVVFTSTPIDRCNFLEASDPLNRLRELLTRFTLCPRFENSGGHFGRVLLSDWSNGGGSHIKELTKPGKLLEKVIDGWRFSGNFHDLSCGFSVYVADKDIARELLELMIANYASDKYKEAVNGSYRTAAEWGTSSDKETHQSKNVVYFNPHNCGFYVARPNEEQCLPVTEEKARNMREGNWLLHAYVGSERIGARTKVDYSQLLTDKLEDILK